jgi:hypothetical protein
MISVRRPTHSVNDLVAVHQQAGSGEIVARGALLRASPAQVYRRCIFALTCWYAR